MRGSITSPVAWKTVRRQNQLFHFAIWRPLEAFSLGSRRHHPRSICGVFRYARCLGKGVRRTNRQQRTRVLTSEIASVEIRQHSVLDREDGSLSLHVVSTPKNM